MAPLSLSIIVDDRKFNVQVPDKLQKKTVGALAAFEEYAALGESAPLDLAAEEIRIAANELGRISGRIDVEELLDVIFRDFCIGK